eukprot:5780563-Pyramimonas_sp.AAC.1
MRATIWQTQTGRWGSFGTPSVSDLHWRPSRQHLSCRKCTASSTPCRALSACPHREAVSSGAPGLFSEHYRSFSQCGIFSRPAPPSSGAEGQAPHGVAVTLGSAARRWPTSPLRAAAGGTASARRRLLRLRA